MNNDINIKLYGTPTQGYAFLKKAIMDYLEFHNIPYAINEINNIETFIKDGIESLPSIVINNGNPIEINEEGNLYNSIKQVHRNIANNLAQIEIRKILCFFDFTLEAIAIVNWIKNHFDDKYYTLYLFDITHYNEYKFKSGNSILKKFAKDFEQSYIGDMSCNLLIESFPISNRAQINYRDFETIFIPYTKSIIPYFYNHTELRIAESHKLVSSDTFLDKVICFNKNKVEPILQN